MWFHFQDFKILAEWHYFATSHGKSTCDGIGGTIKRLVYLFCLQHTEAGSQITTPQRLFEWAAANIKGIRCMWVGSNDVAEAGKLLELRFRLANPIFGIRSGHAVLPSSNENFVTVKRYSNAIKGEKHEITAVEICFEDVKGFVTILKEERTCWELAYVEEKFEETKTLKLRNLVKMESKKYVLTEAEPTSHPLSCILTLPQPSIVNKGRIVRIVLLKPMQLTLFLKDD